jgi:hypothetical protein
MEVCRESEGGLNNLKWQRRKLTQVKGLRYLAEKDII